MNTRILWKILLASRVKLSQANSFLICLLLESMLNFILQVSLGQSCISCQPLVALFDPATNCKPYTWCPCRVARWMLWSNVSAMNQKNYFKKSLAIPLLVNFISALKFRFNDLRDKSSKLLILVPVLLFQKWRTQISQWQQWYSNPQPLSL